MKAADGTPIAKTVGDTVCQVCSRPNPVWFTPNATWNAVVQPPTGVFCPVCFIVFAATKGVDPTAWVLLTEDAYERISAAEERERVMREAMDSGIMERAAALIAHRAAERGERRPVMCGKNDRFEMLSVALDACLVVQVLIEYESGRELSNGAKDAITTIGEVKEVLDSWGVGTPRFSHHSQYRYGQMELIHKVAKKMEPPLEVSELEQWLANIKRVREFFSALQGWANSECLHS